MIFDFRLRVFFVVSNKLSFTKAAQELFITQPAVTKHIKGLEEQLRVALFTRHGNNISLTPAGNILFKYAEHIFSTYAAMENELAQLSDAAKGTIRIGASTTLAQYVLPKILALFKRAHPAIQFTFVSGNSEFIEQQITLQKIDIAIVEGNSHHPQITYEPFVKDEIVLVTRTASRLAQRGEVKHTQLPTIPLILREQGSGTLDVITKALKKINVRTKDLNVEIQLGSTESIKQYLLHSESAAFLSIHAIVNELRQKELSIIDIKGMDIYRTFQFIQLRGQTAKLPILFKRFCLSHYNFKL
jgi:DNA-binding transcriptional LysR family regulator